MSSPDNPSPGAKETIDAAGGAGGDARRRAREAILATCLVYVVFGLMAVHPWTLEVRGLALIVAFYFLPGWVLRREPDTQRRYQVGPESPFPEWSWRGARVATIAATLVFPPFVFGFWWFYWKVCAGQLEWLSPLVWLESLTPWVTGVEDFVRALCRPHRGGFWPEALRIPLKWREYYGLGFVRELGIGLFAVALAEEVFHRGYLMSALEDRWPARRKIFGVPFGLAAVLSSLLFAVGHLVGMAQAGRLVTFFPALVFAWLWRRSGSLWAPALFHTAANLLMDLLLATTFPR